MTLAEIEARLLALARRRVNEGATAREINPRLFQLARESGRAR